MARPASQLIEINLKDQKRLLKLFNQLKGGAQRKILRPALTAGMTPAQKKAKRNAPVDVSGRLHKKTWIDGGSLKKSIGKRVVTYSRSGAVLVIVGVRKDFSAPGGIMPSKYLHLVERGTTHRWQKKTGAYVGRVRPTHFLVNAIKSNRNRIQQIVSQKFSERMKAFINNSK